MRTITIQSASQVGKSTVLSNILGFIIDRVPAATLWLMPTLQSATDFMKEVVRPMLEASQTLAAKTRRQGPPNYRRILFEGGYCVFSGGASANVDVNVAKDQIAQMLAKTETGAGTFISLLGQAGRRSAASIRT